MSVKVEHQLIRLASSLSVVTAVIILAIKIYGLENTDSQSILASLVDSMLDISSSLLNLIAIRIALQPPDHNHRFGHEKFQDLAVFSQSMFFCASGIFTFISSARSLFEQNPVTNPEIGIQAMYWCLLLTFLLVCYQSYVIKKTKSDIIAADKVHYFADFLTNIAVILSLYLCNKIWGIDALCGISISLYILYSCYSLFRQAIRNLVDEEMPDKDKQKILTIIINNQKIKGIHDFKTRYAANKPFIQFHLEMDGAMSLNDAHQISDQICEELLKFFPNAEIIIHQDPEEIDEPVGYREVVRI
jgi:ferrous-iron efflux pump FieF